MKNIKLPNLDTSERLEEHILETAIAADGTNILIPTEKAEFENGRWCVTHDSRKFGYFGRTWMEM